MNTTTSTSLFSTPRFELRHKQSGQYLAIKVADTAELAVASLLAERGYGYYTPEVIVAKALPSVDRTDWTGKK